MNGLLWVATVTGTLLVILTCLYVWVSIPSIKAVAKDLWIEVKDNPTDAIGSIMGILFAMTLICTAFGLILSLSTT
jgi:hypothetical protein